MAKKNGAREGFRFAKVSELKEGMKANFCFFVNLTVKKIDHDNKKVVLEDKNGNIVSHPFSMIDKYKIEIEN